MRLSSGFDLDVVVPAYKAERTIERTVDSVLGQKGLRTRVIVVVDGVFDRTAERLRGYPPEQVQVLVEEVNGGASRARNRGLDQVGSEHVMFIDADDFVEGQFFEPLLARIRETGADMGFAPIQLLFERENRRLPRFVPQWRHHAELFRDWHAHEHYVGTIGTMWRTAFVRAIGGWDPEITRNDDGELVMRAVLMGGQFVLSCSGQGVYVIHSDESINHRADNMASMLRANRKLLRMESPVVAEAHKRRVCAEHFFNIACHAYRAGRDDIGDEAFAEARALGVRAKGSLPHQLGFRLLGPRRLARWTPRLKQLLGRT